MGNCSPPNGSTRSFSSLPATMACTRRRAERLTGCALRLLRVVVEVATYGCRALPQFICKCKSDRPPGIVRPPGSSTVPGLNLLREFPENFNGRHPYNWYSPSPRTRFIQRFCLFSSAILFSSRRPQKERKGGEDWKSTMYDHLYRLATAIVALLHHLMMLQLLFEQVSSRSAGYKR